MKAAIALALVLVAACGRPDVSGQREVSPRQTPTVTQPGVTITGYANVGVAGRL
jgi:hypothetical protein